MLAGVQNMRERGSIAPRHFLLKDEKWWQVAGGSKVYFLARHFKKIFKVPRKVRK